MVTFPPSVNFCAGGEQRDLKQKSFTYLERIYPNTSIVQGVHEMHDDAGICRNRLEVKASRPTFRKVNMKVHVTFLKMDIPESIL